MDNNYSRKIFLKKVVEGIPVFTGLTLFVLGCNDTKKSNDTASKDSPSFKSCDDLSGLSASDKENRVKLNYVEKSPDKNKECKICALYIPAREGMDCGGCTLIKGPIRPEGTCTYFAAIEKS